MELTNKKCKPEVFFIYIKLANYEFNQVFFFYLLKKRLPKADGCPGHPEGHLQLLHGNDVLVHQDSLLRSFRQREHRHLCAGDGETWRQLIFSPSKPWFVSSTLFFFPSDSHYCHHLWDHWDFFFFFYISCQFWHWLLFLLALFRRWSMNGFHVDGIS